jgi:precorrin-6Y C5,15-methyltransferase (decarboxylating)
MTAENRPLPIHIVGVGDDGLSGLTESARRIVADASLLAGPPRALEAAGGSAEKLPFSSDLDAVVRRIDEVSRQRSVVVLVGGDPLFYGVAQLLVDRLGKERVEITPHVSSMQLAFARVKEDWDEAFLGDASRHGIEQILDRIRVSERAGLFTTETWPPQLVARAMTAAGLDRFRIYVCENLGTRNEVVTQGSPSEIAEMEFGPLCVMVLVRETGIPDPQRRGGALRLFGNPDDAFRQSRPKRGLLTPAEVRVLALAELNLRSDHIVWDVGAGSGAVSIEAARLAPNGRVFAIEPDGEDAALIRANAETFDVSNIDVIAERAPGVFSRLPVPDAVFIGGLGRETVGILAAAFARLKPGGNLAFNMAGIDSVVGGAKALRDAGGAVNVLMVNVARGVHQLDAVRFQAVNPSFLVAARKNS